MKKLSLLLLLFYIISLTVFAQEPTGYYSGAENKNDAELKTAIHNIIKVQSVFSYDEVQDQLKYTDEDPNNTNNVILLYSGWSYPKSDYGGGATNWNKEHTWAKSQGNFGTSNGPGTDLHHLRPTDATVNSTRNNLYFDNGGSLYTDGSRYGGGDGNTHCYYDSDSWEPQDSIKGDVARMLFYMAVRYESNDMVDLELAEYSSTSGLHGKLSTLLQWNRQDPVGTWEIRRNNRIYERQKNRNPFIDYPELAEYIWGTKNGQSWSETSSTDPLLTMPSSGSTIDFGNVAYNQNTTISVTVKGKNLTGDLTLAISGTNAARFSIPVNTISKTDALAGYQLTISFNASTMGSNKAQLTISGGGITPAPVNLSATSTDSFLALAASNVTSTGFRANWTNSANATGYLLDVYSYTINGTAATTLLEEGFTSGKPSTWTSSGYQDNILADNIKLASGSQNGAITTPALDLSGTATLTVRAKQYSNDTGALLTVTVDGDPLRTFTTAVDNQDFTAVISEKTSTSKITFSASSGARVYIDYVKVATEGATYTMMPVSGYPRQAGNVLGYSVSGLSPDSTYYYTVTPEGNSAPVSEVISVLTLKAITGMETGKSENLNWFIDYNVLRLSQLPSGCRLVIFDSMGKTVANTQVVDSFLDCILPHRGVYLVQVYKYNKPSVHKIIY